LVSELNADPAIHGILVQLPLPKHLKSEPVIQSIAPEKDVDGLNVVNAGKLATGDLASGLISCTPAGALILINKIHGTRPVGSQRGRHRSFDLFGKPMGMLLLSSNAPVTMAHSRSKDLPGICRNADILVAAVGRPHMVRADWVKPGATVVDVGINRVPRA
jgi:methylenetetrahydrofolate dehydrogenase (NADP+)/methenyltetrahydrofolate cyclohydrolase